MNLDALIMKIITGSAPCAVGLDLNYEDLPQDFIEEHSSKADALEAYYRTVIDAVSDIVAAVSFNMPVLLPYGRTFVKNLIEYAQKQNLYIIADAKCCGEPTASKADASFYLNYLNADAVTVSPYYGQKGLEPFFDKVDNEDKTMFILSHSDSGSPQDFQELMAGMRSVYRAVCEKAAIWGEKRTGNMGYSNIGVAIGGVQNSILRELRRTNKKTFYILTGYDNSKTTAHDLNGAFDMRGLGGIVYVGKEITLPKGSGTYSDNIKNAAVEIAQDLKLCF